MNDALQSSSVLSNLENEVGGQFRLEHCRNKVESAILTQYSNHKEHSSFCTPEVVETH